MIKSGELIESTNEMTPEYLRELKHTLIVSGDTEPTQLRRQAWTRVDFREGADTEFAVGIDLCQSASVADGISDDERIRPTMQESEVEGRARLPVLEAGHAEGAILLHRKYDEAIGIRRVRSDHSV